MRQQLTQQTIFEVNLGTEDERLQNSSFDELLSNAIESAFSVMGEDAKRTFYCCIEKEFHVGKATAASNLETFAGALEKIFGEASRLVEIYIMKELSRNVPNFRYDLECGELCFLDYVKALRLFVYSS